jgi:hypothetical protein
MSKNYRTDGFAKDKTTRAFVSVCPDRALTSNDGAHIGVTFFMSPEEALELADELRAAALRADPSLRHLENDE